VLKLTVNKKDYSCIEKWEEMSIEQAIDLLPVLYSLPESWRKVYQLQFTENPDKAISEIEISDEDLIVNIPKVYGDIIEKLTDIPKEVIDFISPESSVVFYNQYLLPFAIGLLVHPYNYEYKQMKSFVCDGAEYFFPLWEKDVNGEYRPISDLEAIAFTESADLQLAGAKVEQGKFNYVPHIIAIFCKAQGEKYDEKEVLRKAELFKKLPVTVAWEVFFYSTAFSTTLKSIYPMLQEAAKYQIKPQH